MVALVKKIVLSLFMLVTIFVTLQIMDSVESFRFIPRVKVGITNKLSNSQLSFHCKDKHRDNGFHTLAPNETYIFGFVITPIFINRTQWFCLFSWDGESHYFDIYVQIRDKCDICGWIIQKSGPCKYYTSHLDCYSWTFKGQHELQGRRMLLISNTSTQQEPPLPLKPLNSHGRD
ncbi:putative plant self-incompatibility S1 [Lupinus albus]|uniref:S-protein homolog n=1 Tax=Lupinus albus TaxID=3870 RepID=A0A6A4QFA3_LUPAL|nr:putative plant self-incompatibility S1 [Lupinus albus]